MKFTNTSISLRKLITLSLLFIALFAIDSCRRNDVLTEKQKLTKEEEAIAALKERYKDVKGTPFTIELNQKLPAYIIDNKDNLVPWSEYISNIKLGLAAKVPDNCLEAPEHTILSTNYTLDCTTATYTVAGKYKILVDATIVPQSPTNSTLKTAGRINYYDLSGVLTSTSGYIYNVAASDIVYVRETVNSNLELVNEYEVTFIATGIDPAVINSTGYMMLNLRYYTSCGGQANSPGLSPAMFTWDATANPCLRNDKVWISPPSGSNYGAIGGTNIAGMCILFPGSWVNPDAHSVAIFDITSGGNSEITGSPFIVLNSDIKSISGLQVGRQYRFEYKNIKLTNRFDVNSAVICITSNPSIEIWQF